jgi:uncharacterized protein YfdQ (DUF2303 family)
LERKTQEDLDTDLHTRSSSHLSYGSAFLLAPSNDKFVNEPDGTRLKDHPDLMLLKQNFKEEEKRGAAKSILGPVEHHGIQTCQKVLQIKERIYAGIERCKTARS